MARDRQRPSNRDRCSPGARRPAARQHGRASDPGGTKAAAAVQTGTGTRVQRPACWVASPGRDSRLPDGHWRRCHRQCGSRQLAGLDRSLLPEVGPRAEAAGPSGGEAGARPARDAQGPRGGPRGDRPRRGHRPPCGGVRAEKRPGIAAPQRARASFARRNTIGRRGATGGSYTRAARRPCPRSRAHARSGLSGAATKRAAGRGRPSHLDRRGAGPSRSGRGGPERQLSGPVPARLVPGPGGADARFVQVAARAACIAGTVCQTGRPASNSGRFRPSVPLSGAMPRTIRCRPRLEIKQSTLVALASVALLVAVASGCGSSAADPEGTGGGNGTGGAGTGVSIGASGGRGMPDTGTGGATGSASGGSPGTRGARAGEGGSGGSSVGTGGHGAVGSGGAGTGAASSGGSPGGGGRPETSRGGAG